MASRWAAANARMATGTLTKSAGAEMEKRIQGLRNEGKGILKIGRELGVGTALVQRVLERARVN